MDFATASYSGLFVKRNHKRKVTTKLMGWEEEGGQKKSQKKRVTTKLMGWEEEGRGISKTFFLRLPLVCVDISSTVHREF